MIKYKTHLRAYSLLIEAREVIRETNSSVVYSAAYFGEPVERREAKKSDSHLWTDTWEEGHAALMAKAEAEVASLRLQLEQAKGRLGNIKGMKPPVPR